MRFPFQGEYTERQLREMLDHLGGEAWRAVRRFTLATGVATLACLLLGAYAAMAGSWRGARQWWLFGLVPLAITAYNARALRRSHDISLGVDRALGGAFTDAGIEFIQGEAVTVIPWKDIEGHEATSDVLFVRWSSLGPRGNIAMPRAFFASAREADEAAALLARHVVPRAVPPSPAPAIDWKKIGITTIVIIVVVLIAIAYGALTRS